MTGMMNRVATAMLSISLSGAAAIFVSGCGPTYPNCDNDEHCHEGEFCVNGRCQDCRDDSHCPAGQRCSSGACEPIPGYCAGDSACAPDQECVNNRCRPRPVVQETTPTPPAPPGPCQLQAAYFAFDESGLDDTARGALESNMACMRERNITSVQITGMTDPRGTEEYNMALGDRRARSTRDHMQRLGVNRRNMTTRSVGEEMATGADEYSWGRDRRAEFAER